MKAIIFRLFRGEIYKSKREFGLHLMIYFPILVYLFITGYVVLHPAKEVCTVNPWVYISYSYVWAFYTLLYPVIISIFCFSLMDIEYKNDYLKKIFTLPVKTQSVFGAKVLFVVMMSFASSLIAYLMVLGSSFVIEGLYPVYPFSHYDYHWVNFIYFVRLFITTLSIGALQLWLSTVFKTFVVPVGIAGLGSVTALIAQRWEYINFLPYNSVIDVQNQYAHGTTGLFNEVIIINLVYIFIFLFLAGLRFAALRKRR